MRQSWIITTVAGTGIAGFAGDGGPAERARLNGPFDVGFDAAGNLYFSDTFNHRVRRIDARTGVITTCAGNGEPGYSGDGGPALRARLNEPYGIALDKAGNLYIADRHNHCVRRVDAAGHITTFAGDGTAGFGGDGGPAAAAGIHGARAVKVAADGAVYILERQGSTLRRVDPHTGTITTIA